MHLLQQLITDHLYLKKTNQRSKIIVMIFINTFLNGRGGFTYQEVCWRVLGIVRVHCLSDDPFEICNVLLRRPDKDLIISYVA